MNAKRSEWIFIERLSCRHGHSLLTKTVMAEQLGEPTMNYPSLGLLGAFSTSLPHLVIRAFCTVSLKHATVNSARLSRQSAIRGPLQCFNISI